MTFLTTLFRHRIFHYIKIAAVVAAGAMTLTACSGGGGGGGGDLEGRGDITIWYSNNEGEIEWGKQMVEAWNADHPDEQVKAQEIPAGDSSEAVIGAAITAGNAPCLIFNTAPAAVPQFEKAGGLVSLSSFEDGDDYINERSGKNAEQYASADGEFYHRATSEARLMQSPEGGRRKQERV